PGVKNLRARRFDAEITAGKLMPVDYLLQVMRDENEDPALRLDAARSVAPYLHPRLQVIDARVKTEADDAAQLTPEQKRARAIALIKEAFSERPPVPVLAGKPTFRVIEHTPVEQAEPSEPESG